MWEDGGKALVGEKCGNAFSGLARLSKEDINLHLGDSFSARWGKARGA